VESGIATAAKLADTRVLERLAAALGAPGL
jgi:hypothetical protein